MRVSLKYLDGDFKDIKKDTSVEISKFKEDKIAFNTKISDKYAKEYRYKSHNYTDGILEIITDNGIAKFKSSDKEYKKFIKLIEDNPSTKVNHPMAIGIGIIILVFIGIHFGITRINTSAKFGKTVSTASSKASSNTDTFQNGVITKSTVKTVLSKADGTNILDVNSKDFKKIDIGDDGKGKVITVVFKPQALDETDVAQKAANTLIADCAILSKSKSVDCVYVELDEDFEDNYGKSTEEQAVWIKYTRDTMNKIDYTNLQSEVYGDYTKAYDIADNYKISTAIYDKLKNSNDIPANK